VQLAKYWLTAKALPVEATAEVRRQLHGVCIYLKVALGHKIG